MFKKLQVHLPTICTILFFIFINLIFIHQISGNDIWFHLRIGQDIWETKTIPTSDFHSFTNPGATYINQSWLAQLIFFSIYKISGFLGLQILHTLLIFFTFLFLTIISKPKNHHLTFFWIALLSPLALYLDEIRPYYFTWFFLSLMIFLIHKKKFYFIPLIFLFWANIHAGFLLGIGILFFYTLKNYLKSKKKYFLLIFILSLLTSFVTPYGPKIYLYPLGQGQYPELLNITEWQPFQINSIYFWIYFIYILSLIIISIKRKTYKNNLLEFIFIILLAIFGYSSRRHSFIISLVLIPFYLDKIPEKFSQKVKTPIFILSCLIPITIFFWFRMYSNLTKITQIDDTTVPVYGLKFIMDNKISGHVFNDYAFGGYFLWQYPTEKVFIDGRQDPYYGRPTLEYMAIHNISSIWSNLLDKYQINYIILAPNRDLNIILIKHPNWDLVYFDSTSVIYLRHGTYPQIRRLENITPLENQNSKNIDLIIEEFKYLTYLNPKFCFGYQSIAINYYYQRNLTEAKYYLEKSSSICPNLKNTKEISDLKIFLNNIN